MPYSVLPRSLASTRKYPACSTKDKPCPINNQAAFLASVLSRKLCRYLFTEEDYPRVLAVVASNPPQKRSGDGTAESVMRGTPHACLQDCRSVVGQNDRDRCMP